MEENDFVEPTTESIYSNSKYRDDAVYRQEEFVGSLVIHDKAPVNAKYDLCFTTHIADDSIDLSAEEALFIERLVMTFGRKNIYIYESHLERLRFMLIRSSLSRLQTKAEISDFLMLLDPHAAHDLAGKGDVENEIQPFRIAHKAQLCKYKPFEFIYSRYVKDDNMQSLYWKPVGAPHAFRRSIRLKLIMDIIRDDVNNYGAGINLDALKRDRVINAYYPLHNWTEIDKFIKYWLGPLSLPYKQPLQAIREYFGEKIALYFALIQLWSRWLIVPAIIGFALQIVAYGERNESIVELPPYSIFIILWAIIAFKAWRRQLWSYSLHWGLKGTVEYDRLRSNFTGESSKSVITGNDTIYSVGVSSYIGPIIVTIIMIILILMSLATAISLYVIKIRIKVSSVDTSRQWIVSAITAIVVVYSNQLLYALASVLSEWENHRSETSHKSSMAVKVFILQFFNTFSTFYLIAFASPYIKMSTNEVGYFSKCGIQSCVEQLATNLVIIYTTQFGIKNFFGYIVPYTTHLMANVLLVACHEESQCCDIFSNCGHICQYCFDQSQQTIAFFNKLVSGCCNWSSVLGNDQSMEDWDTYNDASNTYYGRSTNTATGTPESPENMVAMEVYEECSAELDYHLKTWESNSDSRFWSLLISIGGASELNSLYSELILALSLVLLFGSTLPVVTFIAFIDIYFMYRRHAWRFLYMYRRPLPETFAMTNFEFSTLFSNTGETDAWMNIIQVVITLAIITNAGLIAFTMRTFEHWDFTRKIWLFFGIQAFLFGFQYVLLKFIREIPRDIETQKIRTMFISQKLVEKLPDVKSGPKSEKIIPSAPINPDDL